MKVTFDGSYGIPSSVSHPAAARHRSGRGGRGGAGAAARQWREGRGGGWLLHREPFFSRASLRRIRSGDCRRRRDLELIGGSEPQPPDLAVMNMIVMIFVILFCAQMIVNVNFVTGLNSDPPSQVKVTCDGFYLQSVKGYIYH
uniref:Uncharacterized protein n=1 Tax=Oryza nivara TaxID=4536 RepID=A0A0E0H0W2_ORYNI